MRRIQQFRSHYETLRLSSPSPILPSWFQGFNGVYEYAGFTSGHFSKAISSAKELTHIHLTVALEPGDSNDPVSHIKDILPMQKWPNLHHFGLSKFSVKIPGLINLFRSVPSLRSVELGPIRFPYDERYWSELLDRMRDELDWNKRDRSLRAAVSISVEIAQTESGRFDLLTDEISNFLYETGEIPTSESSCHFPKRGMGTLYDIFEPEYSRPHVHFRELQELGILPRFNVGQELLITRKIILQFHL